MMYDIKIRKLKKIQLRRTVYLDLQQQTPQLLAAI